MSNVTYTFYSFVEVIEEKLEPKAVYYLHIWKIKTVLFIVIYITSYNSGFVLKFYIRKGKILILGCFCWFFFSISGANTKSYLYWVK